MQASKKLRYSCWSAAKFVLALGLNVPAGLRPAAAAAAGGLLGATAGGSASSATDLPLQVGQVLRGACERLHGVVEGAETGGGDDRLQLIGGIGYRYGRLQQADLVEEADLDIDVRDGAVDVALLLALGGRRAPRHKGIRGLDERGPRFSYGGHDSLLLRATGPNNSPALAERGDRLAHRIRIDA